LTTYRKHPMRSRINARGEHYIGHNLKYFLFNLQPC